MSPETAEAEQTAGPRPRLGRFGIASLAREAGFASGRARQSSDIATLAGVRAVLGRVVRGLSAGRLDSSRGELLLRAAALGLECHREAERSEITRLTALVEQLTAELARQREVRS